MTGKESFSGIDHPIIIIAQAVTALYLFRLFFSIRKSGQPLPQIVAGLAFGVLANLCGRVGVADWFLTSDIVQYCTLMVAVCATYYTVERSHKNEAARPGAKVVVNDFFDRIENKAVWGFGLIIAGVVIYAYVDNYTLQQKAQARAQFVADSVAAVKADEYAAQLCETNEKLATTLTAVTSISATQTTLLANQVAAEVKRKKAVEDIKKQVANQVAIQNKEIKKTLQTTVTGVRPLQTTKPKETPVDDRSIWQKATQFLRSKKTARVDTTSTLRSDTLVYVH